MNKDSQAETQLVREFLDRVKVPSWMERHYRQAEKHRNRRHLV
ncbi:MAG: hypothetical protein ACOCXA_02565 [Planctomycetota bacterium]